jgi:lipopolysaccharide transport system ATP-binding protein
MTDIAISVHNVSKRYHVYENQRARLRHALWPSRNEGVSEVWALQDINFEVKRGDSIAIIGRNGSGKSTLLEIITQTLTPTAGKVQVNGRVAALLELGSGFKPDYTGRENVFLNGLLLGLTRAEVEHRYDEIVSFADIGNVLDRPVKTYSSGMLVRLAFAVQVALEPDILIVDEALSVGDYFFQQKCFGRLRQMREKGLTLLFVSHDMGTVRDLCSSAVYLKQGRPQYVGDSKTAVRVYLAEQNLTSSVVSEANTLSALASNQATNLELAEIKKTALWSVADDQEEGRRILAVRLLGPDGQPATHARMGDTVKVQVFFRTPPDESGHLSLIIKNRYDQIVTSFGSYQMGMAACSSGDAPFAALEIELNLMLEAGLYSLMVAYGVPVAANSGDRLDETDWFGPLQINWDYEMETAPFLGMFGLSARVRLVCSESPDQWISRQ